MRPYPTVIGPELKVVVQKFAPEFAILYGCTAAAGDTFRMRLLRMSAMYRLPAPSTATSYGSDSWAEVASPPSPLKPDAPLPATVLITPAAVILRMRWFPTSAM